MPFKITEVAIRRSRTIVIRIIKFWKIDPEAIGMVTVDECITKSKPKLTAVVTSTTDCFLSNHAQISEVRALRRSFDDPGTLEDLMLIFRRITYKRSLLSDSNFIITVPHYQKLASCIW